MTTVDGDLLWCDGGWPGSCHEHELLELSGVRRGQVQHRLLLVGGAGVDKVADLGEVLDATDVVTLVDRGFRGMAKAR